MTSLPRTPALAVADVRKTYGRAVAVDGLSLEIATGECFGLLGPNGAGKTTTIEICEGLTTPDSGTVCVLGMNWRSDARRLRERIGVQLQETHLADRLSVIETVRLFRSFYRTGPSPDALVESVQIEAKRHDLVRTLSGGQRQRLALACALAGDPELLFLDEPTTGLDPQARRRLWELVRKLRTNGRTIVLTTHYIAEAEELCDRVAIMNGGRIVAQGSPDALIARFGAGRFVEVALQTEVGAFRWPDDEPCASIRVAGFEGRKIRFEIGDVAADLPTVLRALEAKGLAVASLQTRTATLEDAFVAVTGSEPRDD